ncbi:hypothetical protein LB456_10230 [Psychroflexus sp. CAK57W]|uniref:acyltransferase n=1 Tax=Psychroflexus curvus TaxID=2873595 RepID=UPI001CCA3DA5|nr:hypothetical protein [Psychroflexus curvus]MBZ9787831.1 hypothetical protein [Psychroflexus curvus]
MKVFKKILFKLIIICPSNRMRIYIYKGIFQYQIGKNVRIGKSLINCEHAYIGDNVVIGDANHISCNVFRVKKGSSILSGNSIVGKSNFTLGCNSRIITKHYIDCWNNVYIGDGTWLAGVGSQIWTHGSLYTKNGKNLDVNLGNGIYVGSNCLFAPGISIGNDCLIGLGSVVTKSFEVDNTLISGNPAQLLKENINWRTNW